MKVSHWKKLSAWRLIWKLSLYLKPNASFQKGLVQVSFCFRLLKVFGSFRGMIKFRKNSNVHDEKISGKPRVSKQLGELLLRQGELQVIGNDCITEDESCVLNYQMSASRTPKPAPTCRTHRWAKVANHNTHCSGEHTTAVMQLGRNWFALLSSTLDAWLSHKSMLIDEKK